MKRIFSGIQPSGVIHLGNYLGAIKQWVSMQDEVDEAIFCVVDLHAVTMPQDPVELRKSIFSVAAWYLAAGINPEKSALFVQSTRSEHTELMWILSNFIKIAQLDRMTQFKTKAGVIDFDELSTEIKKNLSGQTSAIIYESDKFNIASKMEIEKTARETGVDAALHFLEKFYIRPYKESNLGLHNYPILMAADILLYQASLVPVGEDQKQHVELTRDLAQRFNSRFGGVFAIPEPVIKKETARIMGLDDPAKKMSKSAASSLNYIAMTDDADIIRNKFKRAVTDSGSEIKAGSDKPAITNMLNIFSEVSGKTIRQLVSEFSGKGYGDFKIALAEAVIEYLRPIQERYFALIKDEESLKKILISGSEKIAPLAQKTLREVKEKMGLGI